MQTDTMEQRDSKTGSQQWADGAKKSRHLGPKHKVALHMHIPDLIHTGAHIHTWKLPSTATV